MFLTFSCFCNFSLFVVDALLFEDRTVLLLILILLEGKPAPTAPCGFLQVRFLVLERRSQSSPFAIDVATPGTQSGSDSSRWVSGGELSRFGEDVRK